MTGIVSEKDRKSILDKLAELGGELYRDDDVIWEGKKLVLPENMLIENAISFLSAKLREDSENTEITRTFPFRPWDGAVATWNALRNSFGSVIHSGVKMGMFEVPPQLIEIPVDVGQTIQVPWGSFKIPMLPNVEFFTSAQMTAEDGMVFSIKAEGPKKERYHVNGIFTLIEEELNNNSIYRGKAFDGQEMPKFLPVDSVSRDKIVYSGNTAVQLEVTVYDAIRNPNGKRAILLHGPFGTGKTSTAYLVAQEATKNGWTFVYARPGKDNLMEVFKTARLYQPSVVFFEDLDTIADAEGKQNTITSLLDLFDGFESKSTQILAILTTNYPERITKGMLRPGRLDDMVELAAPDADARIQIVKNALQNDYTLDKNIEWDLVSEALDEYLPAFIMEAATKAPRYARIRSNGEWNGVIETGDLVYAAESLRFQWIKMNEAPDATGKNTLDEALIRSVAKGTIEANLAISETGDYEKAKELLS